MLSGKKKSTLERNKKKSINVALVLFTGYFYLLLINMASPTKKLNKWLIGFIIGGTILGVTGLSSTEKGRGLIGRLLHSIRGRGSALFHAAERIGSKIAKRP